MLASLHDNNIVIRTYALTNYSFYFPLGAKRSEEALALALVSIAKAKASSLLFAPT